MVEKMSTKLYGKLDSNFVMPEQFSFGLEEREDQETENTADESSSGKSRKAVSESSCNHRWEELPKEKQTLANENKVIWVCLACGEKTNTYSWRKP
jgi:hypothetical protein